MEWKKKVYANYWLSLVPLAPTRGRWATNGRKHNWNGNSGSHFAVFWTLNFNKIIIIYTWSSLVERRRSDRACRKILFLQSPQNEEVSSPFAAESLKKKTFLRNSRCKLFDCFLRFAHSSRSSFVDVLGVDDLGVKVTLEVTRTPHIFEQLILFQNSTVTHSSQLVDSRSVSLFFLSSSNYYSRYR